MQKCDSCQWTGHNGHCEPEKGQGLLLRTGKVLDTPMRLEIDLSRLFARMCGNVSNLMPINIRPKVVMPCFENMMNALRYS